MSKALLKFRMSTSTCVLLLWKAIRSDIMCISWDSQLLFRLKPCWHSVSRLELSRNCLISWASWLFQNLACHTGERDGPVVLRDFLSPFLKPDRTLPHFQSLGTQPESIAWWKIIVRIEAMSFAKNFNRAGLRFSGPVPLCCFNDIGMERTPCSLISMSDWDI